MINVPIYTITSDRNRHLLRGFAYLFDKYAGKNNEVVIAGFNPPPFDLPPNYAFYSIASWEYPANLWSDALIYFLNQMPHEIFILCLEDYWLSRLADVTAINDLADYMINHPELLKIDLTKDVLYKNDSLDRLSGPGAKDVDMVGHCDLIEVQPPAQYTMSLQAALWRKSQLLRYLMPNESPWDLELRGTGRINKDWPNVRVYGTRNAPLRYVNVSKSGHSGILLDDGFNRFCHEDVLELERIGAI